MGNISQSYSQEHLVIKTITETIKAKPITISQPLDPPCYLSKENGFCESAETWHYSCVTMCFIHSLVHSAVTIFKTSGPWFWQIALWVFNTTMLLNKMRTHCTSCPFIWRWRMILVDSWWFTGLNVSMWDFLLVNRFTANILVICVAGRKVEASLTERAEFCVMVYFNVLITWHGKYLSLWMMWSKVISCKTFPYFTMFLCRLFVS